MSHPTTHLREAGMLIPLWTLSHEGDLGIGDIRSLRKFLPWVKKAGLKFLQLLPINETDDTNSPYSAISSIAIDPVYLDLHLIPGIPELSLDQAKKNTASVDYQETRSLKDQLLREAFKAYLALDIPDEAFTSFQEREESWLPAYSLFRWLMHLEGNNPNWNE